MTGNIQEGSVGQIYDSIRSLKRWLAHGGHNVEWGRFDRFCGYGVLDRNLCSSRYHSAELHNCIVAMDNYSHA